MQNCKFFTLLRTLDKEELSSFDKQVKKLHGEEDVARAVFTYVKKFHPSLWDEKKLHISYAYRKIFGEDIDSNDYNRKRLLNALSDLYAWLKEFLLGEELEKDSFETQTMWLRILQKRGMETEFLKHAAILQQEVATFEKRNITDYMKGMTINYWFYNQYAQDKASPDIDALKRCGNDLDLYYAVTKLKIACEMANLNNLLSLEFDMEVMPVVNELSKKYLKGNPILLLLYHEVYQLITAHKDDNYARIVTMLSENVDKIDSDELHGILSYLYNYAASKLREGKEEFWEEIHLLNKFGIIHEVFTHKGTMSTTQFSNIVNAACKVKDFNWAVSFIASQSNFLPEDVRDEITIMSNAIILFEKRDFKKTLQTLEGIMFKDIRHAIRSRSLILRSYCEINMDKVKITDFCVAFEAFLRRNRKPKREAVEATLNFIKFVKILVLQKIEKDVISSALENVNPIYFKPWLVEKFAKYKAEFATHKQGK